MEASRYLLQWSKYMQTENRINRLKINWTFCHLMQEASSGVKGLEGEGQCVNDHYGIIITNKRFCNGVRRDRIPNESECINKIKYQRFQRYTVDRL